MKKKTTEEFVKEAKIIHGNKYDYSLVNYINSNNKITILCPTHGLFEQTPNNHLNGNGCYTCNRAYDKNKFITKAKKIHGDKYDYSLVECGSNKDKVIIGCSEHGQFKQFVYSHIRGKGCPKCGKEKSAKKIKYTSIDFIKKSTEIHNNKYDYSLINYVDIRNKIKIICPTHGQFEQSPYIHLQGHGCEKCTSSVSSQEKEINDFIKSLNIETITSTRSIISPQQLDIFIPSYNIAIEFDGLYWHSELHKPSNYHINKTELCEAKGIQLIHIFEDEWLFKKDIVKSRLKNLLGLTKNKIYARKTEIKLVDTKIAYEFLEKNHIQGNVNSSIKLGLYYNGNLVSLMTFGKGRVALGGNSNQYELLRFCNELNTNVIGGADKLLQHFIKNYNPKEIISYADRRWSQGGLYEKLNFEFIHNSKPNYWYIINNNRKHRFGYRKSILVKKGHDKNKTEHQIMLDKKIYRIYDCGTIAYKKSLT